MTNTTNRTLLITKTNGDEIQIDIPVTYKVTFGPAFVAAKAEIGGKMVPMALRIYENDKMQLAIFTDVSSFRDISIPMRIKRVRTQTKAGVMEVDGTRKHTTFQATTSDWIDADPNKDEQPKLLEKPTDEEMFGEEK